MTDELVKEYSSFIYGIAKKFDGYPNKEDLYQAGYIGLITAYKNYKEEENTKFTTYAYTYIYGEMCKLVREDKGIKISRDIIKLKNAIEKATNYLSQKNLRQPTNQELALFLEVREIDIENAKKTINLLQSIDEPIVEEGKQMNLSDIIASKRLDIDTLIVLKQELMNLNEKDRKILLYSMNMSQSEIGNIMDMKQVQVSRTLTKIKQKIRDKVA